MRTALTAAFLIAPISLPAPGAMAAESTTQTLTYASALAAYDKGDMATALIHGKMAGLNGNADAQVLVGHILIKGQAGHIDAHDAAKWFLKAAALGHTDAMVALGELGLAQRGGLSSADALNWLTQAANKGRTDAMRALAGMYSKGKGTAPNQARAQQWLTKAANYGDASSERKLGDRFFESDPKQALMYYEKAAAQGDSKSAYIAAIMYAENFEITPNSAKAAQLLLQAAEAGIAAAQADYGLMVYQGNSVSKSAAKAAQWFKKSALGGDPEGRFLYAFTLSKGDGIAQDYEEAYYWLLRAQADSGKTGADEYDTSRAELQKRLETNIAPAILTRARTRAQALQ